MGCHGSSFARRARFVSVDARDDKEAIRCFILHAAQTGNIVDHAVLTVGGAG